MNEANEKEGVVIDVAPERAPDADPPQGAPADVKRDATEPAGRSRGGRKAGWALLAIALLGAGLVFVYYASRALQGDLQALDERLAQALQAQAELQAAVNETARSQAEFMAKRASALDTTVAKQELAIRQQTAAIREHEQRLTDERRLMADREAELRAAVADVQRRVGGSGNQWKVAEAEYLVRLAGHRLGLARDLATAREALATAGARLKDTHDPNWRDVRAMIARDIAALSAVELPDYDALAARLAELIDQVPALALVGSGRITLQDEAPREPDDRTRAPDAVPGSRIGGLLGDFWGGLKNSVRIRRKDQPARALLTPEHAMFVRQNLVLHLEAARLGLVRQDPSMYQSSLASTRIWLQRYVDNDTRAAQAFANALAALSEVEVRPELPDIDRTLSELHARQRLQEVEPAPAAENVTGAAETPP